MVMEHNSVINPQEDAIRFKQELMDFVFKLQAEEEESNNMSLKKEAQIKCSI